MDNETSLQLNELIGFEITEEIKQQIINDCRNPIKDWKLLNSDNPVKLLYFARVLKRLVLEKSEDKTAIALARIFDALDKATNLMHAWETFYINQNSKYANTETSPYYLKDAKIKTEPIPSNIKELKASETPLIEANFTTRKE